MVCIIELASKPLHHDWFMHRTVGCGWFIFEVQLCVCAAAGRLSCLAAILLRVQVVTRHFCS